MTTTSNRQDQTQIYRIYIKASPEAMWEAITDPEWTNRYGYTGYAHYDLRPGGSLPGGGERGVQGRGGRSRLPLP